MDISIIKIISGSKGPEALLSKRLIQQIESLGNKVSQMYSVEGDETAGAYEDSVSKNLVPFILGGDRSDSIVSSKAFLKRYDNCAVIFFGAHADEKILSLSPESTILIGARGLDTEVKKTVAKKGIVEVSSKKVNSFSSGFAGGMATGAAAQILKTLAEKNVRNLHISIDLDILDPEYAPGVSEEVQEGVSPEELYRLLRVVVATGMVRSMDIVDYCPDKDRDDITVASVMSAIYGIFG